MPEKLDTNREDLDPPANAGGEQAAEVGLWRRYRETGAQAERDALIYHYLPHAQVVAATYYGRRTHDVIEFEEYLQFARVGLVESVDRYTDDRGAQFKTFASRRMHGAILNGLECLTEKQQQIALRMRLRKERLNEVKAAARAAADEAGDHDGAARGGFPLSCRSRHRGCPDVSAGRHWPCQAQPKSEPLRAPARKVNVNQLISSSWLARGRPCVAVSADNYLL